MISSRDNALARRARAARDGKESGLIFVEGVRLCEEAVSAELEIEVVLYTPKFTSIIEGATSDAPSGNRHARLLESLQRVSQHVALVSESVFASVSDTKTSQGIIALARRLPSDEETFACRIFVSSPLILVLHRISNPSNAGAVVRAAEAAGVDGVIVTEGSTDLFSPKALRGAMGSTFRLPLWTNVELKEVFAWCSARVIRTVCADARAAHDYTDTDWQPPCALIVGTEASGLSQEEIRAADTSVRIPMRAPVESLNVAVAAAIVLFEAARQRRQGSEKTAILDDL